MNLAQFVMSVTNAEDDVLTGDAGRRRYCFLLRSLCTKYGADAGPQESSDCVISSEGSFEYGVPAVSVHVGSGCSRLRMLTNKLPWPFFVSAVVFVRILFSTLLRIMSKRWVKELKTSR